MKKYLLLIAAAMATVTMGLASAQSYSNRGYGSGNSQVRTVRCASSGPRRVFCPVNTMGEVRLSRQLSRRACVRGRNWSYSSRGIWVANGCRADFIVGRTTYRNPNVYRNPDPYRNDDPYRNAAPYRDPNAVVDHNHYVDSNGRLIHCESTASGRTYCGDSHSRYTMSGNRDPDCIEGQTWGRDARGVWVSGNCDADFSSQPYDDNGGYDNGVQGSEEVGHTHSVDSSGQLIHCQATADGRTYCGDHDSEYVISGTRDPDCIEGVTYGRDERGTWVSGDCAAEFSVDPGHDAHHH